MKLDCDCVRDLLLTLEEKLNIGKNLEIQYLFLDDICKYDMMRMYSKAEIVYTTQRLIEAGFINASVSYGSDKVTSVVYISIKYDGHQFLETVREESIWNKTKETAKKVGSFSIGALGDIAASIVAELITQNL